MRKIKFIVIGAIVFSLWFAVSWMLPWHDPLTYKPMPNGDQISQILAQSIEFSGTYAYPGPPSGSSMEESIVKHEEGPIAVLWFKTEGENPMNPLIFLSWSYNYSYYRNELDQFGGIQNRFSWIWKQGI